VHTTGVPARHAPAPLQRLMPLQALPSSQVMPAATGWWTAPFTGSQESAVQGLPSSMVAGVPFAQVPAWQVSRPSQTVALSQLVPSGFAGLEQTPVAELQTPTSRHAPCAEQMTGLLPVQTPLWQVSDWVQALLSLQAVPLGKGVCVGPEGPAASMVHGLPSSTTPPQTEPTMNSGAHSCSTGPGVNTPGWPAR
jgi:hypothetical protein